MGNVTFIKDGKVHVKPLRSRLEALQQLHLPTTTKGCRNFTGMENILSMLLCVLWHNYQYMISPPIHD